MRSSSCTYSQDSPVPGGVIIGAPVETHKKSITHLQKLFDSIKDKNQVTADGQVNKMKEGQNGTSVIQSLGDQQWLAASQQAENKLDEALLAAEQGVEIALVAARQTATSYAEYIEVYDENGDEVEGGMKLHAPRPHRLSVGDTGHLHLETESDRRLGSEDQNLVPYIESMMETIIGICRYIYIY
jgi:hypothetical protein